MEPEILAATEDAIRVVFISARKRPPVFHELSLGAAGYLTMHADEHELRSVLELVANNYIGLSAEAERLRAQQHPAPYDVQRPPLTKRERQILSLMARSMKSREISKHLFISRSTVKKDTINIYRKLGAKNRTHAVAIAICHKLI